MAPLNGSQIVSDAMLGDHRYAKRDATMTKNLFEIDYTPEQLSEQLDLEGTMDERGSARYDQRVTKDRERGRASSTKGGAAVIRHIAGPLAELVEEETARLSQGSVRRKPPHLVTLQLLPPRDMAALTLFVLLDHLMYGTNKRSQAHVAFVVGNHVVHEATARLFRKNERGVFERVLGRLAERSSSTTLRAKEIARAAAAMSVDTSWHPDRSDKVRLGMVLLSLAESCGLVCGVVTGAGKSTRKTYALATSVLETITRVDGFAASRSVLFLPTIMPPRPWENETEGGYWTSFKATSMILRHRPQEGEEVQEEDMPLVFKAMNYLQAVPFRVNRKVLDTLAAIERAGWAVPFLPSTQLEKVPPRPWDIDTNGEARKAWRINAREVHERNTVATSKVIASRNTVSIAESFVDRPSIYFPKVLDFRGRIYDLPISLKPQGDDLSKGLLEFADAKPLGEGGRRWLAIHGANVFGNDKISLDARVAWVEENSEAICAAAEEPLVERMWLAADKPLQFLAFCFEWSGACADGAAFASRLPVAMDGSCNGLQHLSAALRDPIGGEAVNLLPSDKPEDIYTRVLDKAVEVLKRQAALGEPRARAWLPLMKRSVVKRPVMTLCYGATLSGFADQIMEDTLRPLVRDRECPFSEPYISARYLATILWEATGEVLVAAREAMDWLKDSSRVWSDRGEPISWTTPSGFRVVQDYRKEPTKAVNLHVMGKKINFKLATERGREIDKRKMAASIAPNWVHAMDASHLVLTVNKVLEELGPDTYLSMVHDSYATHACDADGLARATREAFVEMYEDRCWLADLGAAMGAEPDEELPTVPAHGDLDLGPTTKSLYFFA